MMGEPVVDPASIYCSKWSRYRNTAADWPHPINQDRFRVWLQITTWYIGIGWDWTSVQPLGRESSTRIGGTRQWDLVTRIEERQSKNRSIMYFEVIEFLIQRTLKLFIDLQLEQNLTKSLCYIKLRPDSIDYVLRSDGIFNRTYFDGVFLRLSRQLRTKLSESGEAQWRTTNQRRG